MYLSKLLNVFVQIAKNICPNSKWIGQVKGGWEAYYCDRSAVGGGIPDPHTSLVGDSPNALHTYILYFSKSESFYDGIWYLCFGLNSTWIKTFLQDQIRYFLHDFFMISNVRLGNSHDQLFPLFCQNETAYIAIKQKARLQSPPKIYTVTLER